MTIGDWAREIHMGWIRAAILQDDPDWARALFDVEPLTDLLTVLPPDERSWRAAEIVRAGNVDGQAHHDARRGARTVERAAGGGRAPARSPTSPPASRGTPASWPAWRANASTPSATTTSTSCPTSANCGPPPPCSASVPT